MSEFNSKIFGRTRNASAKEAELIIRLVQNCPVSVFQTLNKRLNEMGLMISITALGEDTGSRMADKRVDFSIRDKMGDDGS